MYVFVEQKRSPLRLQKKKKINFYFHSRPMVSGITLVDNIRVYNELWLLNHETSEQKQKPSKMLIVYNYDISKLIARWFLYCTKNIQDFFFKCFAF